MGPNLFKDDLIPLRNAFLSVLLTFSGENRKAVHVWRGTEAAPRWQLCPSSILDPPRAKILGFRAKTAAERRMHVFSRRESRTLCIRADAADLGRRSRDQPGQQRGAHTRSATNARLRGRFPSKNTAAHSESVLRGRRDTGQRIVVDGRKVFSGARCVCDRRATVAGP